MKKTLLMAGALLALTAGVASAQSGLNLSWTDCGAAGAASRTYACTSNTGSGTMYGSVVIGQAMPDLRAHEGVFDIQTNQAALSPWWTFVAPGNCRLASHLAGNSTACASAASPWENASVVTSNITQGFNGPNRLRFRTVVGMNPGIAVPDGSVEYFCTTVILSNARSTGLGACAGCLDGACIVFNSSKMAGLQSEYTISGPIERDFVTFQAGGGLGGQCPGVTPTKSSTWGSVKSLYR